MYQELYTDEIPQSNSLDAESFEDLNGYTFIDPNQQEIDPMEDDSMQLEQLLLQSVGMENFRYALAQLDTTQPNQSIQHEKEQDDLITGQMQDYLINLFFDTVHILLPVINRIEFLKWYHDKDKKTDDIFRKLIMQTIIFSALAHVSQEFIENLGFKSLPEVQDVLFNEVYSIYRQVTQISEGRIELAQTALLLSYWSPYDESKPVNTFWCDEAIKHATVGKLYQGLTSYDRVVWWCCIVRNRILSLGLRRTRHLKIFEVGSMLTIVDFDLIEAIPDYPLTRKMISIAEVFIKLCKLSEIIYDILIFRSRPRQYKIKSDESLEILKAVSDIDQRLAIWSDEYEKVLQEMDLSKINSQEKAQIVLPRIIYLGTLTSLYEPYTTVVNKNGSMGWTLHTLALTKVKSLSHEIASQVGYLLSQSKIEDFSLTLPAWIIFPICIHLIGVNRQSALQPYDGLGRLKDLMFILRGQKSRYKGADHVTKMVDCVIKAISVTTERKRYTSMTNIYAPVTTGDCDAAKIMEIELMANVAKILKSGLADGVLETGNV